MCFIIPVLFFFKNKKVGVLIVWCLPQALLSAELSLMLPGKKNKQT